MTPSWIRAPPLSFSPTTGAPTFIARSMTFTILFACISPVARRPDLCRRPPSRGISFGAAPRRARRPPWGAERGGASLILRGLPHGRERSTASSVIPSVRRRSLEHLERPFDELVFAACVVHDDEGAVGGDVVGASDHLPLRGGGHDPLPDRRALPPIVLQEKFDSGVPVSRVQVVDLIQEVVEELIVRDEQVHLPLQRRRVRLDVG